MGKKWESCDLGQPYETLFSFHIIQQPHKGLIIMYCKSESLQSIHTTQLEWDPKSGKEVCDIKQPDFLKQNKGNLCTCFYDQFSNFKLQIKFLQINNELSTCNNYFIIFIKNFTSFVGLAGIVRI